MDPIKNRRAERQDLVTEIVEGRRRLHELPEDLSPEECAAIRREALERLKGASMEHSGSFTLDAQRAASRHCENFLGAAQIPLGVTGPFTILGEYVSPDEEIYVPLATTEGALVASANRGCSAVRAAGGAVVRVEDVGMTRAPVFRSSGIEETQRFLGWVRDHEDDIRTVTEGTSRHLKLVDIRTQTFGTSIYVRFRFKSGDAMGMNMATIACDRLVRELIEPETGVACVALSGNFCVDKKPSFARARFFLGAMGVIPNDFLHCPP